MQPNYQPSPDGTCSRECEQWWIDPVGIEDCCGITGHYIDDEEICPPAYRALLDVVRAGWKITWNNMETSWHEFSKALDAVPKPLLEDDDGNSTV